jgi:histidinol-phosphatase
MDATQLQADLDLALRLADLADELTMASYRKSGLHVETKPDRTPVTEADRACEALLRTRLVHDRPDDSIAGEEFGELGSSDRHWVIDPIDGTANYLRGVPIWCTLIGLTMGPSVAESTPVVGVVSAPALGRRWWAAQTRGAYTSDLDGSTRRIHASAVASMSDASFSFSDEVGWDSRGATAGLRHLIGECWRTRAYGDFLSHVLVAEGAVDIAAEPSLMPWDMAALVPVVTEAGGRLTGFDGSPALAHGSAVSTNRALHGPVVELLSPR